MDDRRKVDDRRAEGLADKNCEVNNRRIRPDRRLNSIAAEWIPLEHIKLHPTTRLVFSKR